MSDWDRELPDARDKRRGVLPQREREQRIKKKADGDWLVVRFHLRGAKWVPGTPEQRGGLTVYSGPHRYEGGRLDLEILGVHRTEAGAKAFIEKKARWFENLRRFLNSNDWRRDWYTNYWGASNFFYCHRDTYEKVRAALREE